MTRYTLCVRTLFSFIALFFLALAPVSHAEEIDAWDFRTTLHLPDSLPGITMAEKQTGGIAVNTAADGFLVWNTPFLHPVDVLTLRIRSEKPATIGLVWHPLEDANLQVQRDMDIQAGPSVQDIHLSLHDWKSWNWQTEKIGLALPAGSAVLIEQMIWRRYSFMEKMSIAWDSFWTFDEFRAYSINFLWGPLIAFNPVALSELYQYLPPPSWSVTRIFYAVMGIGVLIGLLFYAFDRQGGKKILLCSIFGTLAILWLVFDARMGLELLSYAVTDYKTSVAPPVEDRTFRSHGNLYTMAHTLLGNIRQYDRYVLFAPEPSPFYSNFRYITYPSVALQPDQDLTGVKLWAVLRRQDIRVVDGHLVDGNGTVLTGTGKVIQVYSADTFLFATP